MILGTGLDLVALPRIRRTLERFGARFTNRVLSAAEQAGLPSDPEHAVTYVAGRFAAKEAAVKALGTGFALGVTLTDVEVLPLPSGRPVLRLCGEAARRAETLGVRGTHISLTHERDMAAAVVILED